MRELRATWEEKAYPKIAEFGNFFANAVQRKFTEEDDCSNPVQDRLMKTQRQIWNTLRRRFR
jgi:5-methylthioribose kinase